MDREEEIMEICDEIAFEEFQKGNLTYDNLNELSKEKIFEKAELEFENRKSNAEDLIHKHI